MADSFVTYPGDGSQTDFAIPFSYLEEADVNVFVNDVAASFTFINPAAIRIIPAPAALTSVRIKRTTLTTSGAVDFTDGSNLLERDLDLLAQRTLFIGQETTDLAEQALSLSHQNVFSARDIRVTRVAEGIAPTDAATVGQLEQVAGSSSAAAASAAAALAASVAAQTTLPPVQVVDYPALRAYDGVATLLKITGFLLSPTPSGIAGDFVRLDTDITSADNGGTVFIDALGRRWGRIFDGKLRPEYWGADPNVTFSYDPAITDGTPTGSDSATAFRTMMAYAQSLRRAVISLRPGGNYYATGDNPCGVQTNATTSCVINIEGNHARIYWRPTLTTDSCFGKMGLLYTPEWSNFRVFALGAPGDRRGTIFNTKLGYANIHFFSQAHFDNIVINNGNSIGCDKVFNFEADGTHSHDDLSVFEGIYAVNYNTFCKLRNGEAVANVFRRCVTFSYTAGAVTFDVDTVGAAFSGYLDIDRHVGAFFNVGETFLKTKDENVLYPIYVRSPRMEKRANVAYKLFDLGSCRVVVSGWSSAPGSSSTYFDNTNQYARIGQYASLVLEDCYVIDGNFQIDAGQQTRTALMTKRSSFIRHFAGSRSPQPFPKIKWGTYASRTLALAAGVQFNQIVIDEPEPMNNMALALSFNRRQALEPQSVVITALQSTGKASLSGTNSIPEDVLFESLYLRVEAIATTNVDKLDVLVTTSTGGFIKTYSVTLTGAAVGQELITSGKVLAIPVEGAITYSWSKSGAAVTDAALFPEARIEARYRTTVSAREGNGGAGAEINVV